MKSKLAVISFTLATAVFGSSELLACPVTYSYIGTVTHVSGGPGSSGYFGSIPIGAQVTGTYTFDFDNVNANGNSASNVGFGPIGSTTSTWTVWNSAGSDGGGTVPVPTGYVFSSTAQVGGFTYSSTIPDPQAQLFNSLFGNGFATGDTLAFNASEMQTSVSGLYTVSSLYIKNSDGTPAFSKWGLPVLSAASTATGEFELFLGGSGGGYVSYVDFTVTSLKRVTGGVGLCTP
jgi:hypothetical protein